MNSPFVRKAGSTEDRIKFAAWHPGNGPLLAVGAIPLVGIVTMLFSSPSIAAVVHIVVTGALMAGFGFAGVALSRRVTRSRSSDMFATLIESVRDAVVRFQADGRVGFLSRSAEVLFGCRRYELDGAGFAERVHVMDRPAYLTALAGATKDGTSRVLEIRMRRDGDDAGYFWTEMCLTPIASEGAGPFEAVAVLRDVSGRKAADEALERARIAAQDASDAKSRFLATMGHELRTPLNAIVGFSEMMKAEIGGSLSPGHKEYAGLIHQSGHHLLDIINMLLDMSKIEAGKFELATERFDPASLAEPCLQLVRKQAADRNIALKLEVAEGLPFLCADERACRQILINLLSNAVKFSHDGGAVSMTIRRKGATIVFRVQDKGIGMGPQSVKRLGEPFYQAQDGLNRNYEGTGLGLSIVKGLVGLHGGRLDIASRGGEGTVVSVTLPIAGPGAAPASADIEPLRIEPASKVQDEWPDREQRSAAR